MSCCNCLWRRAKHAHANNAIEQRHAANDTPTAMPMISPVLNPPSLTMSTAVEVIDDDSVVVVVVVVVAVVVVVD